MYVCMYAYISMYTVLMITYLFLYAYNIFLLANRNHSISQCKTLLDAPFLNGLDILIPVLIPLQVPIVICCQSLRYRKFSANNMNTHVDT